MYAAGGPLSLLLGVGREPGGPLPGSITDLQVGYVDPANPLPGAPLLETPELITSVFIPRWTAATDEDDAEVQIGIDGEDGWLAIVDLDLVADVVQLLEESTTHKYRVRAISATGRRGPWSNTETATTFTPGWTIRDSNFVTINQSNANPADLNLDLMGALADTPLSREIGDRVLLLACGGHGAVTGKQLIAGPATGWTERCFANQAVSISMSAVRVLVKDIVGGEGVVEVFDSSNATVASQRTNYFAVALTPKGTPASFQADAFADPGNIAPKTFLAAGEGAGVLAWAVQSGTSISPAWTGTFAALTGETLAGLGVNEGTTGAQVRQLVKLYIVPFGTDPADWTIDPNDAGNNSFALGFEKVLVAA